MIERVAQVALAVMVVWVILWTIIFTILDWIRDRDPFFSAHKTVDRTVASSSERNKGERVSSSKARKTFVNFRDLYARAVESVPSLSTHDSIVSRQMCSTSVELDSNVLKTLNRTSFRLGRDERSICYGCNRTFRSGHPVYMFSCHRCGRRNERVRELSRDATGYVCLVTGGRAKLGHQIALKLLRMGATVVVTSRFADAAHRTFAGYDDSAEWTDRLHVREMNFDSDDVCHLFLLLEQFLRQEFGRLDMIVNSAAQTIRARERLSDPSQPHNEHNRYGDAKFVSDRHTNSWQQRLADLSQVETEEVMRINAVAPALLVQAMVPLLQQSVISRRRQPYIINVHSREGLFGVTKNEKHIHLNMAKAAMHMLTRSLREVDSLKGVAIHGVDPGWFSVDEYYEGKCPLTIPPIDEIDAAARVLYPFVRKLAFRCKPTRRHNHQFVY